MDESASQTEESHTNEAKWEDQKSFIGFYCDPSVKKRVERLANAKQRSVSETVRGILANNLPRL